MLEDARKRLRNLVQLIERTHKPILYSDFTDELGESTVVELPGTGGGVSRPGGSSCSSPPKAWVLSHPTRILLRPRSLGARNEHQHECGIKRLCHCR